MSVWGAALQTGTTITGKDHIFKKSLKSEHFPKSVQQIKKYLLKNNNKYSIPTSHLSLLSMEVLL